MARKCLIFLLGLASAILCIGFEIGSNWTHLQRYYFSTYVLGARSREVRYRLLYVLDLNGWRIADDIDVVRAVPPGNASQGVKVGSHSSFRNGLDNMGPQDWNGVNSRPAKTLSPMSF
jgi:hypothetical protein